MATLAEDLVILAVGVKPKLGPGTGVLPLTMRAAIRGAELVTLTMAGRVSVADGRISVLNPTPLGDPALDELLANLVRERGALVAQWMSYYPAGFVTAYFDRLHAAGALTPVPFRALGLIKTTGYIVADQAYFQAVSARMHTAVMSPGSVDPAMEALAGLAYVGGLSKWAYPGAQNAPFRARLEALAGVDKVAAAAATRPPQAFPHYDDPNRLFPPEPADQVPHEYLRERGIPLHDAPRAATDAGAHAAVHAATQAATQAAVHAAVTATVQAATFQATHPHHPTGSTSSGSTFESHHHSGSSSSSSSSESHHHH